tara:strand:+ start:1425 stop:1793 length:369 start_codon:yes stop_codon:yes gene_type:complete
MNIQGKLIKDDIGVYDLGGNKLPSGEEQYDIVITDGDSVCYYPLMMKASDCKREMEKRHGISPSDIKFEKTSYLLGLEALYESSQKKKEEDERIKELAKEKMEIAKGIRCKHCRQLRPSKFR